MKVIFIQDIMFEYIGPMYISAVLKKAGHSVDLLIPNNKDYLTELKDADIIAMSCMSSGHNWYLDKAKEIKNKFPLLPIVFGGPHPTFFPDIINNPNVDFVCVGEGEYAMLDLVNALQNKTDTEHIPNIYTKSNRTEIRPLVDINELPMPDRSIYYKYDFLRKMPTKKFITGRGCPYQCTFCFNATFQDMYRGKGKYVRRLSPRKAIDEIKFVRDNYLPLKTVRFSDDTFAMDKKWLKEFLVLYKQEINLPFTYLLRAGELTDELARLTKEAGCISVWFGIESGNDIIRNNIMKKQVSRQQIIETAALLRKYKIKFGTYNMIGNPDETIENIFETIDLNIEIKTNYPGCTIFQPYPKTKIFEYCHEKHYIPNDFTPDDLSTMFDKITLDIPHKDEVENLHKFFILLIKYPWLRPLVRKLIKLKPNPFFKLVFMLCFAERAKASFNVGFFDAIRLGIKLRKTV